MGGSPLGWGEAAKVEEAWSRGNGIYFHFLKRGAQKPAGRQAAAGVSHALTSLSSPGLTASSKGSPGPTSSPSLASLDLELGTQRPESMQRCMWYFASCREKWRQVRLGCHLLVACLSPAQPQAHLLVILDHSCRVCQMQLMQVRDGTFNFP